MSFNNYGLCFQVVGFRYLVGYFSLSDFTFTFTFMHWRRKWQPTPVFLPGESQGQRSLMDCRLWGCTELDMTEATSQQQQQAILVICPDSPFLKKSFQVVSAPQVECLILWNI